MISDVFCSVNDASRQRAAYLRTCAARLAAMLLLATALPLAAQQVDQVTNLFTGIGSEKSSFSSSANGVIGGLTYFAVEDREHGLELWVTDGTAANTHLFADICPGLCSGDPSDFFVVGNTLLFAADDGRHGSEPWRLVAGQAAPTMIGDLNPGVESSSPEGWKIQLARVGTSTSVRVFFSADDRDHGRELWRVSALGSNPTLEADIEPGRNGSAPEMIGAVAGGQKLLVLATTSANGREPYLLSYTALSSPPSVNLLVDTSGGGSSGGVSRGSVLGSKAWFISTDFTLPSSQQTSVWSTDGTAANTIKLVSMDSSGALVPNATLNRMFFAATASATGNELYVSDGSIAGTAMVKDINPGFQNSIPTGSKPVARAGAMLFLANEGTHGNELWSSDGTAAGTNLLKELVPGGAGVGNNDKVVGAADNSVVYITYTDQLWRSDGSAAGTTLVKDIGSGTISRLSATGGADVLFGVNIAGVEPWFSDGISVGTLPLGNFNDGIGDADPEVFAPIGERMSFVASGDSASFDTYSTTGFGASVWFDRQVTPLGYLAGRLLFGGSTFGTLQLSDGTTAGTTSLPGVELHSSNDNGPPFRCSVALNGSIYFVGRDPIMVRNELYRSDGSASGAVKVTDVIATDGFVNSCEDDEATVVGLNGQVLFSGVLDNSDTGTGSELMRTNGVDPAELVFDINPGSSGSSPQFLTALGNKAVFAAFKTAVGIELWVTDGTAQGTSLLKDITPGEFSSDPESLVLAGNQVFFIADSPTSGRELWVTNGTPAGTRLVVDLFPGSGSAFLSFQRRPLAVQGRRVYFHATTPADDCALFVSDGSAAGTHCAVDPLEGLSTSGADEVLALPSGVVAFTAWRASDGDEVRALHAGQLLPLPGGDVHPGSGNSQPLSLTTTPRGMVYFSADDGNSGREVWRMDLTDFLFADGFE